MSVVRFLAERKDFLVRGLDYGVVAVLGAQSSGKSTLLNALFGMHFQVLSQESGRQRTTHGVWLGIAPQAPRGEVGSLVVLDVEGTDGNERQDELSFERKSSLFSLAVSSVLIVNIWFQDVGRYSAANLSLLKTVFDINLQLFGKEAESSRTLILFVIRDHVKTPLESLKATLMGDLQKVWASLQKPEGLEDKTLGDYFDIDFAALPHLILDPAGFEREMGRLRARFLDPAARAPLDPAAPEGSGWLLSPKHRKGIPADGFCQFTETIWDVIKQNKDLDLPSQRHMLATYRCEEMSDAAWKGFAAEARARFHDTVERDGEIAEGFGRAALALLRKWLASYRVPASRYLSEVSRKKGEELETRMLDELLRLFRLQVTAAVASSTHQLDTLLDNAMQALARCCSDAGGSSGASGAGASGSQHLRHRRHHRGNKKKSMFDSDEEEEDENDNGEKENDSESGSESEGDDKKKKKDKKKKEKKTKGGKKSGTGKEEEEEEEEEEDEEDGGRKEEEAQNKACVECGRMLAQAGEDVRNHWFRLTRSLSLVEPEGAEGGADAPTGAATGAATGAGAITDVLAAIAGDSRWSVAVEQERLFRAVEQRVRRARQRAIAEVVKGLKLDIRARLDDALGALLDEAPADMWARIRALVDGIGVRTERCVACRVVAAFRADAAEVRALERDLKTFVQTVLYETVQGKTRYLAFTMEKRFHTAFCTDSHGLPRRWRQSDNIAALFFDARDRAEAILDLYAYLRLDAAEDHIHIFAESDDADPLPDGSRPRRKLLSRPRYFPPKVSSAGSGAHSGGASTPSKGAASPVPSATSPAPSATSPDTNTTTSTTSATATTAVTTTATATATGTTEGTFVLRKSKTGRVAVDRTRVLLTSEQCQLILDQFRRLAETSYMEALREQESVTVASHVPGWVFAAMGVLGLNELWYLVRHPLLLVLVLLGGLLWYACARFSTVEVFALVRSFATRLVLLPFQALRDWFLDFAARQLDARRQAQERDERLLRAAKEREVEMERLQTQARLRQSREALTGVVAATGHRPPAQLPPRRRSGAVAASAATAAGAHAAGAHASALAATVPAPLTAPLTAPSAPVSPARTPVPAHRVPTPLRARSGSDGGHGSAALRHRGGVTLDADGEVVFHGAVPGGVLVGSDDDEEVEGCGEDNNVTAAGADAGAAVVDDYEDEEEEDAEDGDAVMEEGVGGAEGARDDDDDDVDALGLVDDTVRDGSGSTTARIVGEVAGARL